MPQSAERRQPSAPAILRRDVAAGLVGFGGFYLGDSVDDFLSMTRFCFTLTELISSIE